MTITTGHSIWGHVMEHFSTDQSTMSLPNLEVVKAKMSVPMKKKQFQYFADLCVFKVDSVVIIWQLHLQLPVQSVPITTKL